jgi:hypothetical protein
LEKFASRITLSSPIPDISEYFDLCKEVGKENQHPEMGSKDARSSSITKVFGPLQENEA